MHHQPGLILHGAGSFCGSWEASYTKNLHAPLYAVAWQVPSREAVNGHLHLWETGFKRALGSWRLGVRDYPWHDLFSGICRCPERCCRWEMRTRARATASLMAQPSRLLWPQRSRSHCTKRARCPSLSPSSTSRCWRTPTSTSSMDSPTMWVPSSLQHSSWVSWAAWCAFFGRVCCWALQHTIWYLSMPALGSCAQSIPVPHAPNEYGRPCIACLSHSGSGKIINMPAFLSTGLPQGARHALQGHLQQVQPWQGLYSGLQQHQVQPLWPPSCLHACAGEPWRTSWKEQKAATHGCFLEKIAAVCSMQWFVFQSIE